MLRQAGDKAAVVVGVVSKSPLVFWPRGVVGRSRLKA